MEEQLQTKNCNPSTRWWPKWNFANAYYTYQMVHYFVSPRIFTVACSHCTEWLNTLLLILHAILLCMESSRVCFWTFFHETLIDLQVKRYVMLNVWYVNTLASSCFRGFSEKRRLSAHGFAWEFLWSYKPLKRRGKSSSVHSKKFFAWGVQFFCEWRHKWRTFKAPWPTLPGPGHQPLGGSILLKFLLETRLQFESFDTLDDLLGFRVLKLC